MISYILIINILIFALCYFIFEKYNFQYSLENGLIIILSYLVFNNLLKKTEGFENDTTDEQLEVETLNQEDSPTIVGDIIEEITISEEQSSEELQEEQSSEEPQEEPQEEQSSEEPQEEQSSEEPQEEQSSEEYKPIEEIEIVPYSSDELQKLQKKYTIMPVETWIKNEISLMSKSQQEESKSCMCPTLSRESNDYLEF